MAFACTNACTNGRTNARTNAQVPATTADAQMPLYVVGGSVHAGVCAQVQLRLADEAPAKDMRRWAIDYLDDCLRYHDPKDRRDQRPAADLSDAELIAVANATPPDLVRSTLQTMMGELGR